MIEIPTKVWKQMSEEEVNENMLNSFCGMVIYNGGKRTILMGADAIKRLEDFRQKMIDKYKTLQP